MKATPEQYKQWIEFQENNKGDFNKLSKALEYAKTLGINEKSNCKNCGDIQTPDWEDNWCFVCSHFKIETLKPKYNHPDPLKMIYKEGFDAGYKAGAESIICKAGRDIDKL